MKSRVITSNQNSFHHYNLFDYLLFTNKNTRPITLFESGMQRSFLSCRVWHKYIRRETYVLIYLMYWYSNNYTIWPLNEHFLLLKIYDEKKVKQINHWREDFVVIRFWKSSLVSILLHNTEVVCCTYCYKRRCFHISFCLSVSGCRISLLFNTYTITIANIVSKITSFCQLESNIIGPTTETISPKVSC